MPDLPDLPTRAEAWDALAAAVEAYVAATGDDGEPKFCTGWVLAATAINPQEDDNMTSYVYASSPLPFHVRLGILVNAVHDTQHPVR